MLDEIKKIKVYKRSDASEVDANTCRIGLGESLTLFIGTEEKKYFLSKADPLGKFKTVRTQYGRESHIMVGWWFCEDYIIIHNFLDRIKIQPYRLRDDSASVFKNIYDIIRTVVEDPHHDYDKLRYYCDKRRIFKDAYRYKEAEDGTIYKESENNFYGACKIYKALIELLPQFEVYQQEEVVLSYSSVGEGTYLKLLDILFYYPYDN